MKKVNTIELEPGDKIYLVNPKTKEFETFTVSYTMLSKAQYGGEQDYPIIRGSYGYPSKEGVSLASPVVRNGQVQLKSAVPYNLRDYGFTYGESLYWKGFIDKTAALNYLNDELINNVDERIESVLFKIEELKKELKELKKEKSSILKSALKQK